MRLIALARAIRTLPVSAVVFASAHAQRGPTPAPTDIVHEASIADLQAMMTGGRTTAVALVDAYLARINAYEQRGPALNALIRVNPKARADAAALDAERRAGRVRGPMHGIPVILKDNFSTAGLETTAGVMALAGFVPAADAFQVRKLREAGAIILGKSNLHELASGYTSISSMGGQTCNPYDPERNPGGSSGGSGAAVAASFAAVAFGTDTCGSIRVPSAHNNLFGLRPTKGLSSIDGIIPLAHSQDVGGPMARTATDLAIALDATIGADPSDTATKILAGRDLPRFAASLDTAALRGARIGVLTAYFGTEPDDMEATRIVRTAIDAMKAQGAEIIDVAIPGMDSVANRAGVINYEFKYDLIDYLARTPGSHVKSIADILASGLYHTSLEGSLRSRDNQGTRDSEPYRTALRRRDEARDLVVRFLDAQRLDAIVFPTVKRKPALIGAGQPGINCALSANTGLPEISVPAGFTTDGLPIGMSLLGRPLADARLVAFAFDYEQAARPRRAPDATPPLVRGRAPEPAVITVATTANGVSTRATFRFDASRHTLEYTVRVSGVAAAKVFAASLDRGTADKAGPIVRRLSGPGVVETNGTLKLTASQQRELLSGALYLTVHTSDRPGGAVRAQLTVPALQ